MNNKLIVGAMVAALAVLGFFAQSQHTADINLIVQLNAQVSSLTNDVKNRDSELADLRRVPAQIEIRKLKDDYATLTSYNTRLEGDNKTKAALNEQLTAQVESLRSEIQELNTHPDKVSWWANFMNWLKEHVGEWLVNLILGWLGNILAAAV